MNMRMVLTIGAISLGLWANAAAADITVSFIEGAPKDRFVIENTGSCAVSEAVFKLDMGPSQGRLVFDVTPAGAGVEVFQPFEITAGLDRLATVPEVVDGQSDLMLQLVQFAAGDMVAFTIDVDDTIGQREITVTGSEITGAEASLTTTQTATSLFDSTATARLPVSC